MNQLQMIFRFNLKKFSEMFLITNSPELFPEPQTMHESSAAATNPILHVPMLRKFQPCSSCTGFGYILASPRLLICPNKYTAPVNNINV